MATSKKKKSQQAKARSQGRQQAEKRRADAGPSTDAGNDGARASKSRSPSSPRSADDASNSPVGVTDVAIPAVGGVGARASAGLLAARDKVNATLLGTSGKSSVPDTDAPPVLRTSGRTTPRSRPASGERVGNDDETTTSSSPTPPRQRSTFVLDPPQNVSLNWLLLAGVSLAVLALSVASRATV